MVSPGVIATEMVQAIADKLRDGLHDNTPVRRFGDLEELARVVHFLPPTPPRTSPGRSGA